MPPLVIATRNPGKLREFTQLLAATAWQPIAAQAAGFNADLVEPADDYAANAIAKCVLVSSVTGLPALADDSGIEVPALDGWPGPHSARWLGPDADDADRLDGLIAEIGRRCPGDRRARYVAVVAIARPGRDVVSGRGECDGVLVEPRGSKGFGYDPAFHSAELGMTFGEASTALKATVSHRARALTACLADLT